MAIPRVRTDETHRIVYTGDPEVLCDGAERWVPAEEAAVGDGADVLEVHPLSASACRRALMADDREEQFIRAGVVAVNAARGGDALLEALRFPFGPFERLADYLYRISDPAAVAAAEEAGPPAGLKSEGPADGA